MEDEMFNSSGYIDQNPMVIDTNMFGMGSLVPLDSTSNTQIMSSHSTLQGEPIYDLHFENFNPIIDQETSVLRNGSLRSSNLSSNHDLQEETYRGPPFSANCLGNGSRRGFDLHENFDVVKISSMSELPLENLSSYTSHEFDIDTSNISLASSSNWDHRGFHNVHDLLEPINCASFSNQPDIKWGFEKSLGSSEFAGKTHTGLVFPPRIINMPTIPDWPSEISCSGSLGDVGFGSEQASNYEEPSLDLSSYRPIILSHELPGSKYLQILQQILAEVASFSLGDSENIYESPEPSRTGTDTSFSSNYFSETGNLLTGSDELFSSEESRNKDSRRILEIPHLEVEGKKAQLVALLQLVDDKYDQVQDEINKVISAFRGATELGAQIHARFTLHTISSVYKHLRNKIERQIILNEECIGRQSAKEETSVKSSIIQNQWAMQQLRRRGQRLWKPQRGLPEKSVSVLRAWMFQNFLYPYPDDTEKHLLSIRSGLTRSQVSNWFINARVRLWKPMIEEMHTELNNKQKYQAEEEISSEHSKNAVIHDQSFLMNL